MKDTVKYNIKYKSPDEDNETGGGDDDDGGKVDGNAG